MKVLVIGGGGFLGSGITRKLTKEGNEVSILGRKEYPEFKNVANVFKADVRSRSDMVFAIKGQDVVFHTAAIPGIWGSYNDYYLTDVKGTENIIHACLKNKVKKLIYTSSPSVIFNGFDMKGVDENTPYPDKYLCHYSKTKAIAEKTVLAANGSKNLATVCLRPHLIWGPGDPHLLPRLINRSKNRKLFCVGRGENLVDMIYIDNAVDAHLKACKHLWLNSPVAGNCYFVSDGNPVNLWKWIESLLQLLGLPPVTQSISYKNARLLGAMLENIYKVLRIKSEPPMTRFLAAQLAKSHYFNITKASNDFNYKPIISPEEGMKRLLNYYAHQGG
jgi:2-alkyl-3-oxoalkanoate reductase